MMQLKLSEVCSCLNADLPSAFGDVDIVGVSTDTRTLNKGDLFFALTGENHDAHDFIHIALQKGACAVVASKRVSAGPVPVIYVADTLAALQKAATYYRGKLGVPVIAVTGSNGKTTTKDMISHILSEKFKVYSTNKNFNNHIGLPRSVFDVDASHEAAVFELGMNHAGEIELLSDIVRPDIAVITNIGSAHIGHFGSIEGIFSAKMEITHGMNNGGKLILNSDDDLLRTVSNKGLDVIFTGAGVRGDEALTYREARQSNRSISFTVLRGDEECACTIPVLGLHNVSNAMLAIACAVQTGMTLDEAARALRSYAASSMRNEVSTIKGISIIKDYYNASPESMKAALHTLSDYAASGKRLAVLGDMDELGAYSVKAHTEVAELCAELPVDRLFFAGEYAETVEDACSEKAEVFHDKNELTAALKRYIRGRTLSEGDVILIKASRAMRMETVYENVKSFINAEYSDYVNLPPSPTRLYVDVTAIKENYSNIRQALDGDVEIMPMVKANAYGCGAEIIANVLNNCRYLAVADAKEAAMLRRVLPDAAFVIIYQPPVSEIAEILDNGFIPAVSNPDFVSLLNAEAKKRKQTARVHVEIDTGAGRLGVRPEDCAGFFNDIKNLSNVTVDGIFMHYSCADSVDEDDLAFTADQTQLFKKSVEAAETIIGGIKYKHACSGAAIFNQNAAHYNMVRPGYMLYGYYPGAELKKKVKLVPSLRFSSVIIQIRECPAGTPIGYNRAYVTKRISKIATVSAGYSDGLSRALSNRGHMVVNGQRAPIVGTVCMDLTMIDITDISGEIRFGDEVDIFDNINVTVDEIAELCGTIGYEVIAQIEDKADRIETF